MIGRCQEDELLKSRESGFNESTRRGRKSVSFKIYTQQLGDRNEDRDRSLPDVTEQQGQGHESRDTQQEAAGH
jgi:hypothetical protein